MVDHSHLAFRLLLRAHTPSILSYTPMLHSRLTHTTPSTYLPQNFPRATPHPTLDGHPHHDRPLIAQFCSNNPGDLVSAASLVAPYVDAVDLNLGCPQGIARKGHYGAFLMDPPNWDTIHGILSAAHNALPVPITAKIRIFDDPAITLAYARMVLSSGISVLAVHGRTRDMKGHNTGLASWSTIRFLRDNLPVDTVLVANGNVLYPGDVVRCLAATGADAVMVAEGAMYNPAGIFKDPLTDSWEACFPRADIIAREFLNIIRNSILPHISGNGKAGGAGALDPSLTSLKSHFFKLLHSVLPLPSNHHIRKLLGTARAYHPRKIDQPSPTYRSGDPMDPLREFEAVVREVEKVVGEYVGKNPEEVDGEGRWVGPKCLVEEKEVRNEMGVLVGKRYEIPWYRCQPEVRDSPEEAVRKGAMSEKTRGLKFTGLNKAAEEEVKGGLNETMPGERAGNGCCCG